MTSQLLESIGLGNIDIAYILIGLLILILILFILLIVSMVKQSKLLPLTGYIHGGCSPIGMKKLFKTVIDISANDYDKIIFSGGKIGYQIEISLMDLKKAISFELSDISVDKN